MTLLTESEITAWLSTLPGWTLSEDKTSISTSIELVDFVAALDLVNEIGRVAEQRERDRRQAAQQHTDAAADVNGAHAARLTTGTGLPAGLTPYGQHRCLEV